MTVQEKRDRNVGIRRKARMKGGRILTFFDRVRDLRLADFSLFWSLSKYSNLRLLEEISMLPWVSSVLGMYSASHDGGRFLIQQSDRRSQMMV
jgi:hypothetical protein